MNAKPTKCVECGETIPFPVLTRTRDGKSVVLCHECNGDKERLMGEYNKDQAWLHDRQYHGSKSDGEW